MASKRAFWLQHLAALCLLLGCGAGFYRVWHLNSALSPVLPPLAAARQLQQLLAQPGQLDARQSPRHPALLRLIYRDNGHQLLWLDNYRLNGAGQELMQQLVETAADRLRDYDYHLGYLRQRLLSRTDLPVEAAALDLLLTDAFINYGLDVLNHRLNRSPLSQVRQEVTQVAPAQVGELLRQHQTQLTRLLSQMIPPHAGYTALRKALDHYGRLAARYPGDLGPGPSLAEGDVHPQVSRLRDLLWQLGDYPPRPGLLNLWQTGAPAPDPQFDAGLAEALRAFQRRHGLEDDGKLGPLTRRALNLGPGYRMRQIALNMKRWRELPAQLGPNYIWVNLPDYRLQLVSQGEQALDMKVIIGKTWRPTPTLQEPMSSLVLNPEWKVPARIARYDILPKLKQNPNYLAEHRIQLLKGWEAPEPVNPDSIDWQSLRPRDFAWRLQQESGDDNALGAVKFVLPNDRSIYLHDTNAPELFERHQRALSSGCVRVAEPLALASALLRGKQGWDPDRLRQALASGQTRHLRLPEPVPTYLVYHTSWVDDQGRLQFRDDIYQRDGLRAEGAPDSLQLLLN